MKWIALGTLLVGGIVGYVFGSTVTKTPERKSVSADREPTPATDPRVSALQAELEEAKRLLGLAKSRENALTESNKILETKLTDADAESTGPTTGAEIILASRASAAAEELLEKGDIEGLWLLAADLLNQGPEGYEKFEELFDWFALQVKDDRSLQDMINNEELVLGRFFRAFADNDEAVLRYGLHLIDSDREQLSPPLQEFQRVLSDGMGAALMGFYRGGDSEIYSGYLSHFQAVADSGKAIDDELISAIGNIPTEEATDTLIAMLEGTKLRESRVNDVISALAWQGNPRALGALQRYLDQTTNERRRALLDRAIRLLSR